GAPRSGIRSCRRSTPSSRRDLPEAMLRRAPPALRAGATEVLRMSRRPQFDHKVARPDGICWLWDVPADEAWMKSDVSGGAIGFPAGRFWQNLRNLLIAGATPADVRLSQPSRVG